MLCACASARPSPARARERERLLGQGLRLVVAAAAVGVEAPVGEDARPSSAAVRCRGSERTLERAVGERPLAAAVVHEPDAVLDGAEPLLAGERRRRLVARERACVVARERPQVADLLVQRRRVGDGRAPSASRRWASASTFA